MEILLEGETDGGRDGPGRGGGGSGSFYCLQPSCSLQNWKVKSPNLVKIMSSSADVVLIQQITGLYIMSCRWRNQCRGEPRGTRFSPTGRICERCSFVPVSGSSWNLNVHVQIDGFYFTDLFFTLIPEYRKKRWGGKMWLNPVLLKHHQRQFLSLCPLLYYKCTNSNTPQHHNTCSEFTFDHKTDKTQSGSRRRMT